jgi:transposase
VIDARERFQRRMRRWPADKLVFVDESGVNFAMTRSLAWGPRGERVTDDVPAGRWETYSVIAALRAKGVTAPMVLRGAMDTESMRAWVRTELAPTLRRGDIVVLDNVSFHDDPEIAELIGQRGARLEFLPPYSPDLNPIEEAWAKVKTILRAAQARVFDALLWALDEALSAISSQDCQGWFQHAGYRAS